MLSIFSSAIPIIVLQLLILPFLAKDMSEDNYGLLITILSLFNLVPAGMGNVLNNIRLLYNDKYEEYEYEGDFNLILIILVCINLIIITVFSYWYEKTITIKSINLNIMLSIVWLFKEYFIVAFRLKINYVAILINNILQVIGYGIGCILYLRLRDWQLIYLSGYVVSIIYIFLNCRLWKEKLRKTPLFKNTSWQSCLLLISNLFKRLIGYADKMLIYPILGGTVVSVYYATTVLGKVVTLLITPLNGVMLTYLSKIKKQSTNIFKTTFLIGVLVCLFGYIGCIVLSKPVLEILYPQFVDEAMKYVCITTGSTILETLTGIINPFILKFFDMKWQIIINASTALVYVIFCMGLLSIWGLYGFCLGALLTNLFKLLVMLLIYIRCKSLEI